MKQFLYKILLVISIITLIASCSTRKDRFLNRAFHATTTKYNVLYNGKVAYKAQIKQINDNYKDDFGDILPIEPLKIKEELALPKAPRAMDNGGSSSTGGFAKAEEKAVKAVQKHSMNLNGSEKNKQIDDAYLLLGKARYYDQRFVPALETFAYIIKNYPKSKLHTTAIIWEAKSLIRLGNPDEAVIKLDLLLKKDKLSDHIKHEALTAMAFAYNKQDSIQNVINLLDSTLLYKTKNHNQKARNLFILGQLYRIQQKIDSSNVIFEKLSSFKKAPYRFKVHSRLERAKNFNSKTDDAELLKKSLIKLAKNRDNRPFLDGIFFQLGKIALATDNTDNALDYFKKSIRTKQAHDNQKSLAYEEIGNIEFDKAHFLDAGSYYDSVLNLAQNKNTKRIRKLTRKRNSLNEVIRLENIVSKNDSILNLTTLSKEAQENFFNTYIDKLKKEDEEARIIAENTKNSGNENANTSSKKTKKGGKFYFYNAQTTGFGQVEFQKIWGKRALDDNWRLSNKQSTEQTNDDEANGETEVDKSKKYDLDYYISSIPTEEKTINELKKLRNDAYYNVGLIYKEQFKKYDLSTQKLEQLLSFSPNEKMVLPTYYHLYKAFGHFNEEKSDFYKNKITEEYPNTKFAKLIQNPESAYTKTDEDSPQNTYKEAYILYNNKKYSDVLIACKKAISQFSNDPIIPKFELLKAYATAKTTNKNTFIEALEFVKTSYPNTEEGIHAATVIASLKGVKTNIKPKGKAEEPIKQKTNTNKKKSKAKKNSKENNLPSNEAMLKLIESKKKRNMGPPGSK
ncbi:MAG: tetratricopeptide repeat protein [Flavobacteriaceae bacterium]